MEVNAAALGANDDFRKDGDAVRDVGIVARELHDLSARSRRRLYDLSNRNVERRAVERHDRHTFAMLTRQKEERRLRSRRRASPRRIAASHLLRHRTHSPYQNALYCTMKAKEVKPAGR